MVDAIPEEVIVSPSQPNVWDEGDYSQVGSKLLLVAEQLCESADLRAGSRILDVATGHGNGALAAARRDCTVVAVDAARSLLRRGRVRAEAEGVPVEFQEGNAEQLPFENASFDGVISTFGVQFTANPDIAAGELLRVCRSGGVIALANWSPGEFARAFGTVFAGFLPGPGPSPFLWGTENRIRELLGLGLASMSFTTRTFVYRLRTPEAYVELFRNTYGRTMRAFAAVADGKREELAESLSRTVGRFNRSRDETLVLPIEYQEVVAVRA